MFLNASEINHCNNKACIYLLFTAETLNIWPDTTQYNLFSLLDKQHKKGIIQD